MLAVIKILIRFENFNLFTELSTVNYLKNDSEKSLGYNIHHKMYA